MSASRDGRPHTQRGTHTTRIRVRLLPRSLLTLGVLLSASPASAHGTVAAGDFYAGMLHPLIHLESALGIVALGFWLGQGTKTAALPIAGAFVGALALGVMSGLGGLDLSQSAVLPPISMVVFGLLVALHRDLPQALALLLALVFGLSQGYAHGEGMQGTLKAPLGYTCGMVLSVGLMLFYAALPVRRVQPFWFQVGIRIAGSWITAIGALVLAFRYR